MPPDEAALFQQNENLPRVFQLPALQLFLAGDAETRPWHCFQALSIDLFTAGDALAEGGCTDAIERALDHSQELAFVVALVEEELLGVGVGGLVGDVLRVLAVGGAAILLGARDYLAQLLLPLFEPLLERLQLLLVHGVLAA